MRYAIKKPLLSLAFVLVLLSAIALGGCGSVSNGGASDSPAEESLKPADISGYWIVSEADGISLDDTLELGMFSALQFDENGGLKLITHLKDSKVEREGTHTKSMGRVFTSTFLKQKSKAPVPYPSLSKQSKTLRRQSTGTL